MSDEQICAFQDGSYPCHHIENPNCELCRKIRKAGIKEVVDWVEHHLVYAPIDHRTGIFSLEFQTNKEKSFEKWQAKLKDWGIRKIKNG